ncbi:chloroplastic isoform X2 [Micractinium conductrix]|uniref:Chloroplastic isoform X2 n=1 Tax=Micractinium conductrix TaxID=554055 RepID=A0A2P6VGZ2_9CHLO|nr:chloroplastic isoform X2 [Micractinium conductrix]|eukprot:PSC73353.1 chloroplastic isoform X2 [Micractinium conductrix]
MRSDPDVVAVRGGGYPSRLNARAKGLGGAAPAPALGGSLAQQASFRRQQARPTAPGGGALTPGGYGGGAAAGMPRAAGGLPQRSRSTRQNSFGGSGADPLGYCGRRLWRFWPQENPPWVEGFIQQWDPDSDGYTIVYDPNTRESTEEVFFFATAIEGHDYVVGEYVDMTVVHGSRRQGDKPYVSPEALAAPPPPGLLAALAPVPSKKRKSISGLPVPADAPFEVTYLHARLPVAAEDELQQMLSVLERKERMVQAEVDLLEYHEANREDVEARGELERKFAVLCDKEAQLMAEIAALRDAAVTCSPSGLRPAMLGRRGSPIGAPRASPLRTARLTTTRRAAQRAQCSATMESPFKYGRDMDGLQGALAALPTAGVYLLGAALAAGLGGAGFAGAEALAPEGVKQAAKYGGAVVGAALGAFLTTQLKAKRESAAIIELANLLVSLSDPTSLQREQVAAIESKYGINLTVACPEDIKAIYGTFVEAAIPAGDAPLAGREAALIQSFKAALGLSDTDAAPAHIEVGRRILRGRLEASTRGEDAEARKTFQKLIYVSNQVFGDRQAAFLLPWARVFGLTDAQVYVAKRDGAKTLFKQYLDAQGGQLQADKAFLVGLKQAQAAAHLADDEASALVKEAARARVESLFETAVQCLKQRTRVRDYSEALDAMSAAIAFNRGLKSLAGDEEVVAGVGETSVLGGAWAEVDGRNKDLRELFKAFLEERLARDGAFSDSLDSDTAELRRLLGLGNKEAAQIEAEVKTSTYKRLLRDEVTSGRLAAAESKAEVLGDLVERVRFDADAAKAFHESLYRQKLASLLDKKKLTEEDDAGLKEMQVMLCIPNEQRDAMHTEACGTIFKEAVNQALAAGIDAFGYEDRRRVQQSFLDLRLDRPAARAVLSDVARKYFLQYVTQSRNTRNRLDAAKELKKLVFFSNIVVAPLLEDLKTEEEKKAEEAAAKQQADMMELMKKAQEDAKKKEAAEASGEAKPEGEAATEAAKAEGEASSSSAAEDKAAEAAAEAEVKELLAEATAAVDKEDAAAEDASSSEAAKVKSLEKAQVAAAKRAGGEAVGTSSVMKSQKDVTLAADLDIRDRTDIYRNFLLYCMTGDVMQGPMGVTMVTERDEGEFARLSQLGDILGLTQMDVYQVHTGMAEQAFKQNVQSVLGDGNLTPDRAAALEKMREQMGLPKENADKIIRGFSNQKAIQGMQALKAMGQLTLDKVLEIKDAGVDVAGILGEDARQQMYRQEVLTRLSDGTGSFDNQRMLTELPEVLGLDASKAGRVVTELAAAKKGNTLVQAISALRQKKVGETAKELNNLVSCEAAVPSDKPAQWKDAEELADLFSAYCSKEKAPEKQAVVQRILGLSDSQAEGLRQMVEEGGWKVATEEQEEAASFF